MAVSCSLLLCKRSFVHARLFRRRLTQTSQKDSGDADALHTATFSGQMLMLLASSLSAR